MKKLLSSLLVLISGIILFAQDIQLWRTPSYLINVDYEIIKDSPVYEYNEVQDKLMKLNLSVHKGEKYSIDIYQEHFGISFLAVNDNQFVDSKSYKISNNDEFPNDFVYSDVESNSCPRLIPIWYFDALKKQDRDLILKGESERANWDGDITPDVWYKDIPQVSSLVLSNSGMGIYTPLIALCIFKFQSVKKVSDTKYEVVAYPDVEATDNDITWDIYKENFPHIENGNPVKFIIEINGKEMKVYNGETKKICFDLIQVSAEWVKLYESFIRTNNVPAGLELPKEYLERSNKK